MMEMAEELDFAEGTETEHGVIERSDLLDCNLSSAGSMYCRADNTVSTFADYIEYLVLGAYY